jgi:hypothetical protein
MAKVSDSAKVLFYKLLSVVDDYGRFESDAEMLRRRLYMWEIDRVSDLDVANWLRECYQAELITIYAFGGKRYLEISNFKQQARAKSKYPDPKGVFTLPPDRKQPTPIDRKNEPVNNCEQVFTDVNSCKQLQTVVAGPYRIDSHRIDPNVISFSSEEEKEVSPKFESWWSGWSSIRGTNHKSQAAHAWLSVATVDNESSIADCTASYLASLDSPAKGYNPENFLFEQARDGFSARWPPRKRDPVSERKDRDREKFAAMMGRDAEGKGLLA